MPRIGTVETLGYTDVIDSDAPGGWRRRWLGKVSIVPPSEDPQAVSEELARRREESYDHPFLHAGRDLDQPETVTIRGAESNVFTLWGSSGISEQTADSIERQAHLLAAEVALVADILESQHQVQEGNFSLPPQYTSVIP